MAAIRQATRARLGVLRMLHPGLAGKIKDPCHASYHNWIKEIPAVTRAVATHGQVRTRQMFRFVRGHDRPEAAFDKVEYDETKLPFFFFDEDHAIPLRRATLCWFLDVYSHGVCGFYLGFEVEGLWQDRSRQQTLRKQSSLIYCSTAFHVSHYFMEACLKAS